MKNKKRVYDLPTRLFHWGFSGLFLTAFTITKVTDDDSAAFSFHMLAGLLLGFLVVLRIVWGIIGTKHARFSGFALKPSELVLYFKGILTGSMKRWAGHNPASSWAAIIMMLLAIGLGTTGYLMTSGANLEILEDIHELLANTFIIVAALHVTGIILHTLRHREMIAMSMVSGNKEQITDEDSIPSQKPVFGIVLIALLFAFGLNLFRNFDSQNRTLQFFGTSLQLGENENEGETEHEGQDNDED